MVWKKGEVINVLGGKRKTKDKVQMTRWGDKNKNDSTEKKTKLEDKNERKQIKE